MTAVEHPESILGRGASLVTAVRTGTARATSAEHHRPAGDEIGGARSGGADVLRREPLVPAQDRLGRLAGRELA